MQENITDLPIHSVLGEIEKYQLVEPTEKNMCYIRLLYGMKEAHITAMAKLELINEKLCTLYELKVTDQVRTLIVTTVLAVTDLLKKISYQNVFNRTTEYSVILTLLVSLEIKYGIA